MQDRLQALKEETKRRQAFDLEAQTQADLGPETEMTTVRISDSPLPPTGDQEDDPRFSLNAFFETVSEVKDAIRDIEKATQDLAAKTDEKTNTVSAGKVQAVSREIEELMDSTNRLILGTKKKLEKLKSDNEMFARSQNPEYVSSELRIRQNQSLALTKQFMETAQKYQQEHIDSKRRYQETIARQMRIVNPNATQEEIDDAIYSGRAEQVFAERMLMSGSDKATAQTLYTEVQERQENIHKIEASMMELQQLFIDMAVLVDSQQEELDNIFENVSKSVAYTEKAHKELVKTVEHKRRSRKCKCITIFTVMMIVLFLLIAAAIAVPIALRVGGVMI